MDIRSLGPSTRCLSGLVLLLLPLASALAQANPRPWGDSYLPQSPPPARHILAVSTGGLNVDERIAVTCLQGLLARTAPRIWLLRSAEDRFWLERHKEKGFIGDYEIVTDLPALFGKFAASCRGAVVPDKDFYRGDLLAANVAACTDAIVASPDLARRLHLPITLDLRGRFSSYAAALRWLWATYQGTFNHHFCDFRQPDLLAGGTFDYSYEFRAPMFWIAGPAEAQKPGADPAAEQQAIADLLATLAPNSVCVGFPAGTAGPGHGMGEPPGVELLSRYGHALVCTNHQANYSLLSGVRVAHFTQPPQPPAPPLQRDKIYIALVLSDGDNQILWPGFFQRYFSHPAFGSFPLAFGMGPAARELQPGIAGWYFEHATPTTEFIADVSGAGYMQPDHFAAACPAPPRVWAEFLAWTAQLMQAADMKSVRTVGGGDENIARYAAALPFCHSIFADMGRYSGRSGIGNLTYRLRGGRPVFRAVTSWRYGKDGFLREIREQVGTTRPAFVNGFVHCWTFAMDDLAKIYAQRDPDMVFVTPAQLAALYNAATPPAPATHPN